MILLPSRLQSIQVVLSVDISAWQFPSPAGARECVARSWILQNERPTTSKDFSEDIEPAPT